MSRICLKIIQSGDKGGGGDTDKVRQDMMMITEAA